MELLDILISEKWLLSAALLVALVMVNKERIADKNYYRQREMDLTKLLNAFTVALKDIAGRMR